MRFEWDAKKSKENLRKHRVSFVLATTIFDDPMHLSIPDPDFKGEERWITIGMASNSSTLVVIHTDRIKVEGQEIIRIISARRATKKERREYEEGI